MRERVVHQHAALNTLLRPPFIKVELAVPQLSDKSPNREFDAGQTRNVSSTVWSTSTVLGMSTKAE
jgi:hypothetical protein